VVNTAFSTIGKEIKAFYFNKLSNLGGIYLHLFKTWIACMFLEDVWQQELEWQATEMTCFLFLLTSAYLDLVHAASSYMSFLKVPSIMQASEIIQHITFFPTLWTYAQAQVVKAVFFFHAHLLGTNNQYSWISSWTNPGLSMLLLALMLYMCHRGNAGQRRGSKRRKSSVYGTPLTRTRAPSARIQARIQADTPSRSTRSRPSARSGGK
ncbi:hypothetical protein MAR_034240, partial [Mya arenaria]